MATKRDEASVGKEELGPGVLRLTWPRGIIATVLLLLSLVAELKVGNFTLAGGATLAALAALVLLWPLVAQLALRGGDAEFLGLKIKLNELERRSEEDLAVRIEELAADVESMRIALDATPEGTDAVRHVLPPSQDIERVVGAAKEYGSFVDTEEWDGRVAVDKRLIGAGPFKTGSVIGVLDGDENHRETAMAVAVALGTIQSGDDEPSAVEALAHLLNHRSGRVRYRAARSMGRLLRRRDLQLESRFGMVAAVRARLNVETQAGVRDELVGVLADHG